MISIEQITDSSDVADMPINLTATSIYTKSFNMENALRCAFSYKASTGCPSLLLQLEQGIKRPTTEGVSDTSWVIPGIQSDIVTLLNSSLTQHITYIPNLTDLPTAFPFGRVKITTVAATPTNTTLNMKFLAFEDY